MLTNRTNRTNTATLSGLNLVTRSFAVLAKRNTVGLAPRARSVFAMQDVYDAPYPIDQRIHDLIPHQIDAMHGSSWSAWSRSEPRAARRAAPPRAATAAVGAVVVGAVPVGKPKRVGRGVAATCAVG